jgi:hypothetical protein
MRTAGRPRTAPPADAVLHRAALTGASVSDDNRRMEENVTDATDLVAYNYTYFDQHVAAGGHEKDEAAFRDCFHVGEKAQNFTLPQLDGAGIRLSSLWRSKPLVMEFGSFT